jgi:aldose 1-epimerase
MTVVNAVELSAGTLTARVAADRFLQVTSLRHDDAELLVAPDELQPASRVHGQIAGIPFLHPWANRLGDDHYQAGGVAADADDPAVGRDGNGLAIHGLQAPRGAWELAADEDGRTARARLRHDPVAAFPFAHVIEAELTLAPDRLTITTTLTATGDHAVPVAFGWHPYLRIPGTSRERWALALPARTRVLLDDRGLPTGRTVVEKQERRALGCDRYDDGYTDLADGATFAIAGGGRRIAVELLEGYPAGQLYAPPTPDVICPEPMTAPTDALRTGDGLRLVKPGETTTTRFAIAVG